MKTLAKIIADFNTQLATTINIGDTQVTFENLIDDDGVALPSGRYFFTIDAGNSLKEHFSADLALGIFTNLKSVSRQGIESVGAARPHRVGASVVIVNFAHIRFLSNLLDGTTPLDSTAPLKYDGVASVASNNKLATKAYVDAAPITPPIDATTIAKGKSKLSVAPASASNPIVLGDNDPRVPTQNENNAMVGTGTPSPSNKFVTADNPALQNNMQLTGDQTVAGIKTLTSIPVLPASNPTTSNQAARKAYVDALFA